jgi:hypothetical protein
MLFNEGYSIPFAVVTRITSSVTSPFRLSNVDLKADDGIAKNIMLQSFKSFMSVVATILSFNFVFG